LPNFFLARPQTAIYLSSALREKERRAAGSDVFEPSACRQAPRQAKISRKAPIITMQLLARLNGTSLFIQELINRPRQVGAILPSSNNLAVAMARWLDLDSDAHVLELGPGTGSVTYALIKRGLPEDRLIAIEQSPKMAGHLRTLFPRAKIITGDAFQLDKLLKRHVPQVDKIGFVFSSLPLLNFEPRIADGLARKIRNLLPPSGRLIQYSYHLGRKQPKAAAHFRLVASDLTWLNLPPARVSVYQK
jgi:phosphatidylethanolamine/phosphatidyl-N-methylethanolamine N-methyltransferase